MDKRERVRAFFDELESSERLRLLRFFSQQAGYVANDLQELEPLGARDGGLDPRKILRHVRSENVQVAKQ